VPQLSLGKGLEKNLYLSLNFSNWVRVFPCLLELRGVSDPRWGKTNSLSKRPLRAMLLVVVAICLVKIIIA